MLAPGSAIGRYVVKKRLAEGGMAEVYLAQAIGPEGFAKDVVIKVVRSFLATDQQFIDMFIAEARLSSRLNHANVVQIFDFGKHGDSYFIAMEYVRGASLFDLRRRCRERGVPFPPTLVAEIGAQVARGLQYAHSLTDKGRPLGIVHRDVTPHNVLLSYDGAVKLTDFGIAKASTTHTAPGILKGKFAYMSPEQARGDVVDARTDLFALGIVLWEMLTGGRLFDGDSEMAVLRAVQESLIAPPHRLNPDIPAELSEIVLKALARPVQERFQTAFELDKALATFVLRAAKSVEDSSVSLFMQQVYRDEIAADEGERLGTPVGTPAVQRGVVPQASSFGHGDTLAVDRSRELARGRPATVSPRAEPLKTDEMPAAPLRTDQMPAVGSARAEPVSVQVDPVSPLGSTVPVPPSAPSPRSAPLKTDLMPAHRPLDPPALAVGTTDVVARGRGSQPKTDPERQPLGAEPVAADSSTIRVSESVKLEVQRRLEAHQAAQKARPAAAPEPTVLKPRSLSLEVDGVEPTTSATTPETPPPATRSPALIGVSVVAAVLLLVGGGYLVFAQRTPADSALPPPPAEAPPVKPAAELAAVAPPDEAPAAQPTAAAATATTPAPTPQPATDVPGPRLPLEPVPVPSAEPTTAEPPSPGGERPPPPRAAPTVRFGTVAIKAVPYAELVVDGRKMAEVQGLRQLKLPLGTHKVTLVHPKRSETFSIVIDGKAIAEINFDANR